MEVVVKKTSKENWTMMVKCTGKGNEQGNGRRGQLPCGSVLKINADDIFLTFSGGNYIERGNIIHFTCNCPVCGSSTDIEKTKLPESVREYAEGMHYIKEREQEQRGMEL